MEMAVQRHALIILLALINTAAFAAPDRPLVFIPGILGSRLVEARTGTLLWGSANALRYLDQLVINGGPQDPGSSDVVVDGLLTTFLYLAFGKVDNTQNCASNFKVSDIVSVSQQVIHMGSR
jgi:hypothetical protein